MVKKTLHPNRKQNIEHIITISVNVIYLDFQLPV